jgi:hypothetical protein
MGTLSETDIAQHTKGGLLAKGAAVTVSWTDGHLRTLVNGEDTQHGPPWLVILGLAIRS